MFPNAPVPNTPKFLIFVPFAFRRLDSALRLGNPILRSQALFASPAQAGTPNRLRGFRVPASASLKAGLRTMQAGRGLDYRRDRRQGVSFQAIVNENEGAPPGPGRFTFRNQLLAGRARLRN